MPRTIQLDALRDRIRARGEVSSTYLTDAELTDWINESYAELYDIILDASASNLPLDTQSVSIVAGTGEYTLDTDYYRLKGVDVDYEGRQYSLRRFTWSERNGAVSNNGTPLYSFYHEFGSKIYIRPTPQWSGTLTVWFIPNPPLLVNDTDTIDTYAGWDEYVVLDVLFKAAVARDIDPSAISVQKDAAKKRISAAASSTDHDQPRMVGDIEAESIYNFWPTLINP